MALESVMSLSLLLAPKASPWVVGCRTDPGLPGFLSAPVVPRAAGDTAWRRKTLGLQPCHLAGLGDQSTAVSVTETQMDLWNVLIPNNMGLSTEHDWGTSRS